MELKIDQAITVSILVITGMVVVETTAEYVEKAMLRRKTRKQFNAIMKENFT